METISIQDYIKQGSALAQLHSQFVECDVALGRMGNHIYMFVLCLNTNSS